MDLPLAGRSLRALQAGGWRVLERVPCGERELAAVLANLEEEVWLLRAGAWPCRPECFRPPPSATGRALLAAGVVRFSAEGAEPFPGTASDPWRQWLRSSGGQGPLPGLPWSAFLEAQSLPHLIGALEAEGDQAWAKLAADGALRVVRYPRADVQYDPRLRVAQLITSLQRGGAERIALDLHQALERQGVRPFLMALGRPPREAFEAPPGTLEFAQFGSRQGRLAEAGRQALALAVDLLHVHLLTAQDLEQVAGTGIPLLATVHNARPGWPQGLERLSTQSTLLVACAQAVERDLKAAQVPALTRVVWNGIQVGRYRPDEARLSEAAALRRGAGFGERDLVLLAIANPRPQKRLELLPEILKTTQERLARGGPGRRARLVWLGQASPTHAEALGAEAAFREAVRVAGVGADVYCPGSAGDVAPWLFAADVLVSPSRWEGLSLSHLEALASGKPVLATEVGGARECATGQAQLHLLPVDAGPERYAEILYGLAQEEVTSTPASARRLRRRFDLQPMARNYARLYRRQVVRQGRHRGRVPRGVLLITNNFSTGGAQSSARRLLCTLAGLGLQARAAVLQERASNPTPGLRRLQAAGVPVWVLPAVGTVEPEEAVGALLELLDGDPPQAVLLWNVIASYKVLLVDSLLDLPVFDVSPGEMNLASLRQYLDTQDGALPYLTTRQYGARLAGAIVKHSRERAEAEEALGIAVQVIPNGVPWPETPMELRSRPQPLVLGTAARISRQKRLEELLEALKLARPGLPDFVLRVAGRVEPGQEGYWEELRACAGSLPVEWLGEVPEEGLAAFHSGLDLFVQISEPAGCPNASLEALAAGLPVVATDCGGVAEQLRHGVTGLLTPRGDPQALATALQRAAGDAALRCALARAGREHVRSHFGLERMAREYIAACGIG